MQDFPTEILQNIVQHLPLYSQQQCLMLSKSWHAVARTFINCPDSVVKLRGNAGIRCLFHKVFMNPTHGLDIRQIYISMRFGSGKPITRFEYIHLLESCPNLAVLVFVDVNPIYYVHYMLDQDVDLPKLEAIRVVNRTYLAALGHNFTNLVFRFRTTLNQLDIRINARGFTRALAVHSVPDYLYKFANLKRLSLETDCLVIFDDLIKACPRLQELKLKVNLANFRIGEPEKNQDDAPVSQLEVIKINCHVMTRAMYMYLYLYCPFIKRLVLSGPCSDIEPILSSFRAFVPHYALPITNFSLQDSFPIVNQMLQELGLWFPHLRQVELKNYSLLYPSTSDDYHNISLDFGGLDMHYLCVDLSPLFPPHHRSSVIRTALEIASDDFTVWYQREGKWKSRQEFMIKRHPHYLNRLAREKRMQSEHTAVITVKASRLHHIRLHFSRHESPFDQLIPLTH